MKRRRFKTVDEPEFTEPLGLVVYKNTVREILGKEEDGVFLVNDYGEVEKIPNREFKPVLSELFAYRLYMYLIWRKWYVTRFYAGLQHDYSMAEINSLLLQVEREILDKISIL
jgi:hypothetical protein